MRSLRSFSLTTQLGCMFALAAVLTFAGVGMYLYQSLATQLEARDDSELVGKVALVRHLLVETPSAVSIRKDPHRFLDAIAEHDGLILIMRSATGEKLLENRPMLGAWPAMPMTAVNHIPDKAALKVWTLPSGAPARTIAALGVVGNSAERVQIVVARTTSDRMALLDAFRSDVFVGVLFGALLAALAGYALTRKGLRPVRMIATQAQFITAQHLDTRLDASEAPAEMRALVESFNGMLDRLHDSFQRLSQFSGDLAHDMRTPLNNLMLQTQVALSQPRASEEYHALLASNIEEYERLARMVESMLFLARADYAQVALEKQWLDPATELQRIADYFEGIADEAGVTLIVRSKGMIAADAMLIRRAVNNLVANAIRYTAPGGAIELQAYAQGEYTVVAVMNPGPRINAEDLPWLFDRFYRVDRARSGSATSTGLGLAIVQSIMKMHGGQAQVESNTEQTTFRLLFPAPR
ncbi:MAG: heavy metal sensor histidine kinase [Herminiimonas sp.]|nr:heavy metal sensor histidine kinase [Herminiimonas sp.]